MMFLGRFRVRVRAAAALVGVVVVLLGLAGLLSRPAQVSVALQEEPEFRAQLDGVPSMATLVEGGFLELDLATPASGETVVLEGSLALRPVAAPGRSLVFTLDVSGSAIDTDAGCGGDFNGDGVADTVLDCELAAAAATLEEVATWGEVSEVALVVFELLGRTADVGPASGRQLFTGPATDADGDGEIDLETVLASAGRYYTGVGTLTNVGVEEFDRVAAGSTFYHRTNFNEAGRESCEVLGPKLRDVAP